MSTRLYLPSTGAAPVSVPFDAAWGVTTGADRVSLSTTRLGSAFGSKTTAETSSSVVNVLSRQYVSDPLTAQTISGTAKAIIRALESTTTADLRAQLVIRVVSGKGDVVRGTLLAADSAGLSSEFGASLQSRKFPLGWSGSGASLTSVAAQAGDRLVVEIGYRAHNTLPTSRSGTLEYGDAVGTDLAEDETGTSQFCPWVELSATLLFIPKLSTLVDNFDDNSIDAGKWSASSGSVVESGAAIVITPTSAIPLLQTIRTYDAIESSVTVPLGAVTPDGTSGTLTTGIELWIDSSNAVILSKRGANLVATKVVAGVLTDLRSDPYIGQDNWRFRHASDIFYWEVSTDGVSWSSYFSTTASVNLPPLTACLFLLYASQDGTESSPGTARFDSVNYFVVDKTASETGSGTDTAGAVTSARSASDTATSTEAVAALTSTRTASETGSGTDTAGSLTSTRSASETASGTDTAGALVATTPKSDSDVVVLTVTETAFLALSATDAGSGADTAAGVAQTATDTGSGTDTAGTITSSRSDADTATGADGAAAPSASLSDSDTSTALDIVASLVTGSEETLDLSAGEMGSAVETAAVSVVIEDSDSASGTDTAGGIALAASDSASAADAGTGGDPATTPIGDSDSGQGTDQAGPLELSAMEAAVGLDQFPVVGRDDADSASGTDAGSLLVTWTASDTGSGTDLAVSASVVITASDQGTSVEQAAIAVGFADSDSGSGSESAMVPTATLSASDLAAGDDAGGVEGNFTGSDSAAGTDAASLPLVHIIDADSGAGSETAGFPFAFLSASDLAFMAEAAATQAWLAASETARGDDNGGRELPPPTVVLRSIVRSTVIASTVPMGGRFVVVLTLTALVAEGV